MVQQLRISLPIRGTWVQSLVGELKSHIPQVLGAVTKTQDSKEKQDKHTHTHTHTHIEKNTWGLIFAAQWEVSDFSRTKLLSATKCHEILTKTL